MIHEDTPRDTDIEKEGHGFQDFGNFDLEIFLSETLQTLQILKSVSSILCLSAFVSLLVCLCGSLSVLRH